MTDLCRLNAADKKLRNAALRGWVGAAKEALATGECEFASDSAQGCLVSQLPQKPTHRRHM